MAKGRIWTEAEKDYLEMWWGKKSMKTMAKYLNRTVDAVGLKAKEMGLGWQRDNVDGIPLTMLPDIVGVSHGTISKIWVRKKGMTIHKVSHNLAYVKEDDLAEFMKNNSHLYDARKCDYWYFHTYNWFNELLQNERNGIHTNRYHRYTPTEDARIMFLHEVKNQSFATIGKEFGLSTSAIHRRYHRIKGA